MVTLNKLYPKHGSKKDGRRLGLGHGSGTGLSSTKGMKGQTSRSGNNRKESKEGGQMPLYRRVPKSGFSNVEFANKYACVNIGSLEKVFGAGAEVTPESMKKEGLVKGALRVKILGNGELKKGLKVSAHAFSASAKEAIEKSGGAATIIAKKEEAEAPAKKEKAAKK